MEKELKVSSLCSSVPSRSETYKVFTGLPPKRTGLPRIGSPVFYRWISPSEIPQQRQPRKRSCQPWGCCLRPGSPSFPRKIRLSAAFGLRRRDFWSGKPVFSQNKKHIARKRYVVLSFSRLILSHQLFTKQDL